MTIEANSDPSTENELFVGLGKQFRQESDATSESRLAIELPGFRSRQDYSLLGDKNLFLLSGFVHANGWSWLGNSSEVMIPEGLGSRCFHLGIYRIPASHENLSTSTAINLEPARDLGKTIENLFSVARNEVFEDGMESHFSREFVSLIERYGDLALLEAARLIMSERADPDVAAESLKWLGRIDHPGTYSFRISLLKRGLTSSSPRVRDGAGTGLSFLNDPATIPALQQAIEREQLSELKSDLQQVLQQLQHAS